MTSAAAEDDSNPVEPCIWKISVNAIHPKATLVIEAWLSAPIKDALGLQRPLPDGALKIVARCNRTGSADDGYGPI